MPALGPDAPKPWFLIRRQSRGQAVTRNRSKLAVRAGAALAAVATVAVAASLTAGLSLAHLDRGAAAGWARSSGHDALWMGRIWATGTYTRADLDLMAARLRDSGISDVYVFAGQLNAGGQLDPAGYADARSFLAAFRAALPRVQVSAWISGVLGRGHISLASAATRDRIVASAAAAERAGFGGVHYDLEPVPSGDQDYLRLLDATDAMRPRPEPLSVSVPKLEPLPGLRLPWQLGGVGPVFWTTGYLAQVAGRVNQVALMAYDTTMPFGSWYGGYVVRQAELALRAVPARVRLLIGVPCYHYTNLAHFASAETVAAAVRGVRVALTAQRARGRDVGVALFADYSATPQDWRSYVSGWLRPGRASA
jgi:hypothetical protein